MNALTFSLGGLLLFGLSACGDSSSTQTEQVRMDLCVQNDSKVEIFVQVQNEARREKFGVVSVGASKTIGFGSGKIGRNILVEWTIEDLHGPKQNVTLPMPSPTNGKVTLTYQKDGTWTTAPPKK